MSIVEKEWQEYLDEGYTVIMDNDGWWFCNNSLTKDGDLDWVGGGNGPYGLDLLEYLLNKHYSGMESV